jgi:hypothetical protein
MLTTIATVLAGLIGAGITVIGARFLWQPEPSSAGFGIADSPAPSLGFHAWLWVKGVRDIASGVFIFLLIANGAPRLLGAFMLAAALIPFGDALIVLRSKGSRATAYGVHGATAVVMLVIAAILIA